MTHTAVRPGVTRRPAVALVWALRIVGAALLAATAGIHLDLWLDGYRDIETIGPMFLLNVVAGFGLALLLLVTPHRFLPWVAALGALTMLGSLAALILSTTVGLFGFVETTAAALWWETFWVELVGALVLTALAALAFRAARQR
jgi:hypothetical protein